ncbi:AMP-binding protein, partial [bacterium]|nr:AMP-binding protein [bacterium]
SKVNFNKRNNRKINKYNFYTQKVLDKLVFKKIRDIFGGNLRLAISGGSSLDKRIARFFEDVGINIIEGYGLTETSPIISVNKMNNFKFGTVGHVLANIDLKINNAKEILVKGSSVMSGYWQDEEANQFSFDENAYFHTGDLGFMDSDGFLNIIGRKKEIIVLSTGKNIVPYNIEHALNYDKYMDQSIIIGSNRKFLTALVVPDFEELKIYCDSQKIEFDQDLKFLNSEKIKDVFRNRIDHVLKNFASYEQIVDFYILDRDFDQEHDELTPTLKLKRENIKGNFSQIIDKLYN